MGLSVGISKSYEHFHDTVFITNEIKYDSPKSSNMQPIFPSPGYPQKCLLPLLCSDQQPNESTFCHDSWVSLFLKKNYSIEVDLRCCANFCNSKSDLVIPIYAVFFIFIFFSTVVVTEY